MAKKATQKKATIVTEDQIIDFVFQKLYTNLHVNELHLLNDIIQPSGLQLDQNQLEHIREIVVNTGLVNSSVGFKKNGFIYLNQSGIQMMRHHKSFAAFLASSKQNHIPFINLPHNGTVRKTKSTDPKNKVKAKKKA